MKKICIILTISMFALPAFAQIQETPTRQNILRERIERQRQSYMQNLQEARRITEEYQQTTNPEERNILQTEARQMILERLQNTITRMKEIQTSMAERIVLASSRGIEITEIQLALDTSKQKLTQAEEAYINLETIISTQPLDRNALLENFKGTREHLQEARLSLLESIQLLRTALTQPTQNDSLEINQTITN